MQIFAIIALLFIAFSLIWFKQTFAFYCAFKILALGVMCIRYEPPALALDTAINFWFVFLFFIKGSFHGIKKNLKSFPIRNYFTYSFVILVISVLVGYITMSPSPTKILAQMIDSFAIPTMFYIIVYKEHCVLRYFVYSLVCILIISGIYALVEYSLGINLFFEYLMLNVDPTLLEGKFYLAGERLGMIRIQSLFVSPNNLIYLAFICSIVYIFNLKVEKKYRICFFMPLLFFSIFLIFLANSRTVLISSMVVVLPIFISSRKSIRYLFVGLIVLIIAMPFFIQYTDNITSALSSSRKYEIGGSSMSMRQEQLAAAFEIFFESPIWGHGFGATDYYITVKGWADRLLGGESIWFRLLIDNGILGVMTYLYLFVEVWKRCKIFKNCVFLFFMLGYLVANTASSLPGFSMSFLYIGIITLDYYINNKTEKYEDRDNYFAQSA